jgi:zinc and cadmium transporter
LDERFWICIAASSLAAACTMLGIYSIRQFKAWAEQNSSYFVSFAAGVLIAASFLHIIPKSFAMNAHGSAFLLIGFVILHLFNRFITAYVCGRNPDAHSAIGLVPILGIAFHSFMDGVIYSITFAVSVFTGLLAGTGMVLHEFPEGIITYMLLLRSGYSDRKSLGLAVLAAALSTPLGTLVSIPFVDKISPSVLGALLAMSAGALVYVGATHLLPQAEREPKRYSLVALGGGILVAVAIALSEA